MARSRSGGSAGCRAHGALVGLGRDRWRAHARTIFARTDLSSDEIRQIDARLTDATRRGLIVDPAATDAFVALWARSPSAELRAQLAQRSTLSFDLMTSLVGDADATVRQAIASHAALDARLLTALAADTETAIRLVVASRADTPPAVLQRLRKDPAAEVVARCKANPSYKPGFLEKLFG